MTSDWLIKQLPSVMAQDMFIRGFTAMCQEIVTDIRKEADTVPTYFDVGLAPHEFVKWIGSWTGLPVQIDFGDEETAQERVKTMVTSSATLYRRRGTRAGLELLIEAMTGEEVTVSDSGGIFREGDDVPAERHVRIELPGTGGLDARLLMSLIADEIPVNCTFDLVVNGEVVRPYSPAALPEEAGS